ncbi:CBS domain-containing protein [Immundisolibacter sp.]
MPEIRRIMTPFPHTIAADAPMSEAREFLNHHRLHHLPVMDGEQLVGIISDRDLKLLLGLDPDYTQRTDLRVRDAMVTDVYVVDLNTPPGQGARCLGGATDRLGAGHAQGPSGRRVHRNGRLPRAGTAAARTVPGAAATATAR